jgi:hypothetical protein
VIFDDQFDNVFTAESQSDFSFSFAAETPANANHHAFGNVNLYQFYPSGLGLIFFRPLSETE